MTVCFVCERIEMLHVMSIKLSTCAQLGSKAFSVTSLYIDIFG